MIDVGVREDHGIHRLHRKRKMAVPLLSLLAVALVHAAIQQVTLAVRIELVHGAGDRLSGSPESEFHPESISLGGSPHTGRYAHGRWY